VFPQHIYHSDLSRSAGAALALDGFPYVLALTQPMCTSTCFGLIAAVTYLYHGKRKQLLFDSDDAAFGGARVPHPTHENAGQIQAADPHDAPEADGPSEHDTDLLLPKSAKSSSKSSLYVRSPQAMLAFLLIGGLISLANFLTFAGMRGSVVAGPLAVLLQQAVLPCTVLFSWLVLRREYTRYELGGVCVVLLGIALVCLTEVLATRATAAKILAVLLILAAAIPNALALVLMERLLRAVSVDVWWLWTWVNVFEIVFAFPIVAAQTAIESVSMESGLHRGYVQFFSTSTVLWFVLFICCILANKALSYLVIMRDGATLNWLAVAAAIPLADMLFSITPATRAQDAAWMWAVDVAALLIVVGGLCLYHGVGLRSRHAHPHSPLQQPTCAEGTR
jgi:drug/metabolite transporter (DMT)-like permease